MKTVPVKPDIGIPAIGRNPDTGIHRSLIKGRQRYRVWWYEGDTVKATILPRSIVTIEQARQARDNFYAALAAAGASKRNKTASTPLARVRRARLKKTVREPYISVQVNVRGVFVGSFPTMEEAIAARDEYIATQNEIRLRLQEIKRATA